jgi:mannitol/fructose-specific phosphotransferase system IIA component
MLFTNKTKKNMEILQKDNIEIATNLFDVQTAIDKVGNMLHKKGYIQKQYIDAMHQRNESLSVFLGNYLAVPHGEFEAKKFIEHSGISVLAIPQGMDWHGNTVHFVVGLAGKGQEHMEILSNIAEIFQEEKQVLDLLNDCSIEKIYAAFNKGGVK